MIQQQGSSLKPSKTETAIAECVTAFFSLSARYLDHRQLLDLATILGDPEHDKSIVLLLQSL